MPVISTVKAVTAIRMRTSVFGAKELNVGGIIIAMVSRQGPTNIAAPGQGIGQPFENARSIDAVWIKADRFFIGMTRPSIALQCPLSGVKRT